MAEIHNKIINSFQKGLLRVTDPDLRDWIKITAPKVKDRTKKLEELAEHTESLDS